jgi:hypothetical protein
MFFTLVEYSSIVLRHAGDVPLHDLATVSKVDEGDGGGSAPAVHRRAAELAEDMAAVMDTRATISQLRL